MVTQFPQARQLLQFGVGRRISNPILQQDRAIAVRRTAIGEHPDHVVIRIRRALAAP